MPYQPSSKPRTEMPFRREEWDLLVRLPGRVVVAATLADPGIPRRAVAEGLAGIDAIAAGRASMSRLVRDVVAAIYDEADDRPAARTQAGSGGGTASIQAGSPATVVPEVLIACR